MVVNYYKLDVNKVKTLEDVINIIDGLELIMPSDSPKLDTLSKYFTIEKEKIYNPPRLTEEEVGFFSNFVSQEEEKEEDK